MGTAAAAAADDGASSGDPVRVAMVDDSLLIREGLVSLLALSPRVRVVGVHREPAALEAALDAERPQVVLTDIRMPPSFSDEGMRLAERLRQSRPSLGVVVLSQHGSASYAAELLARGSAGRGYLLKDRIHELDPLVDTLCAVAAGGSRIDPQLIDMLMAQRAATRSPLDELTPRQQEILADLAAGLSNLAIAQQRGLTQRSVEKHVSEIFGRLGLASDEDISRRVYATLMYLGRTGA